jgi:multidrug efflux pump
MIAALGVTMSAAANIILDPFFVLPQFLNMGAVGAGAATAISNVLAALFYLAYLFAKRKSTVISIDPRNLKFFRKHIGGIVTIGIPSSVQYALTVVAVSAIAKFVSGYDTEAVAGLGIVKKLDRVPLYFSIGVSKGMLPLLAYNFASGNNERRHHAFVFGCAVSFGFSFLCLICYETFAPFLTRLFINDAATVAYGARFLRIAVIAMPLMSVCYPIIIQFQAMGKVKESLVCSVLRKGVVDIPLLFLMDALFPLYGLFAVQPIVDAVPPHFLGGGGGIK